MRNQKEDFEKSVTKITKCNRAFGSKAKQKRAAEDLKLLPNLSEKLLASENEQKTESKSYTILDLFKNPEMAKVTCTVGLVWLATALSYWGIAFNSASLPGSIFLTNIIWAVTELPVYVLSKPIMDHEKIGRVGSTSWSLLGAGACVLVGTVFAHLSRCEMKLPGFEAFEHPFVVIAFACSTIGKLFLCLTYNAIYLHMIELFPTPVRGSAASFLGIANRLGSLLSPVIIYIYSKVNWLPNLIIGILCISAGILSRWLPETLGHPMLMTFEDAFELYREN